jgi:competence protein ComEA
VNHPSDQPENNLPESGEHPPPETAPTPAGDQPPDGTASSSYITRYRPGIAAMAAVILVVLVVSYAARWVEERFFPDKAAALVICRGPEGGVETLPRGVTVGEALAGWGVDTAGIPDETLGRRVPDGCRIDIVETRAGRRARIDELAAAERYALGLDFDINRASAPELALIPGIGEASAARIVAYRRTHGDFTSEEELCAVPGLGKDKARTIARYVSFGSAIAEDREGRDAAYRDPEGGTKSPGRIEKLTKDDPPIDINRADAQDLMRIPGVGEVTAGRIIECREKDGPFETVADLERVVGIGKVKAQRIAEYVRF